MIAYSNYESDNRIRREAEELVKNGYEVDVICLPSEKFGKNYEINGVKVFTITKIRFFSHRDKALSFLYRYFIFGIFLFFKATILKVKRNFNFLHIHTPPDPLVFFVLHFRIFGTVKIILDRHEPLYLGVQALFKNKSSSFIIRLVRFIEKLSFIASNKIILINKIEYEDLIKRDIKKEKLYIVTNTIDENRINIEQDYDCNNLISQTSGFEKKLIFLYQGLIAEERDLDTLINSISLCRNKGSENFHFIICGDGPYLHELQNQIYIKKLEKHFTITGRVSFEKLLYYMYCTDVGLVLAKKNEFYERYSPNKIFEYYSLNKLALVSRLKNLESILKDSCVYYNPEDVIDMASKIDELIENYNEIYRSKVDKINKIYKSNSWKIVRLELLKCYKDLCKKKL